jgi:carbon storage regulator
MHVFTRKKNEAIVIGHDITVVVVEIRGDKVRLGIEAPREPPVHRPPRSDLRQRNDASGEQPDPT